jgi:hypothetical protein
MQSAKVPADVAQLLDAIPWFSSEINRIEPSRMFVAQHLQ